MTPADASWRLLSLLWQASWQGALFAVAVGTLCLLLRVPAPYRAWLWFLAGLKFIGGFIWLLLSGGGVALNVPIPAEFFPPARAGASIAPLNPVGQFVPWVIAIWAAGAAFCILLVVVRARTTYQTLSRSVPEAPESVTRLLAILSKRIGVSPGQIPSVCVAPEESDGPQVTLSGNNSVVVLPSVLLPPSPTALNEDDLRFVLAHELAHIRRGDLWAGLLFAAMQIVFFFHPFALWVKREWEAAREEACDLMALRICTESDRDTAARYGALLLRLGSGTTISSAGSAPLAASPFAALHRRLTHLNYYQSGNQTRSLPIPFLLGLPVLAALLLPLEFRGMTPSPIAVQKESTFTPDRLSNRQPAVIAARKVAKAPVSTTKKEGFRPRRHVSSLDTQVNLRLPTPKSFPAITPAPLRSRVMIAKAEKPVLTNAIPTTRPVLSEPVLAPYNETPETVATVIAPTPVPVMPEATPETTASKTRAEVTETDSGFGTLSSSRYPDTTTTRPTGIIADLKGIARTGILSNSPDNGRSLSRPVPHPSPSPTPLPVQNTSRPVELPAPPQE